MNAKVDNNSAVWYFIDAMKTQWTALLVLFFLGTTSLAQAQFTWTTNSDGVSVTITGYTGPGGAVTIPAYLNDLVVTTVGAGTNDPNPYGDPVFSGSLTSVTIPSTVTSIAGSAFLYCTSLTNVTIPNTVAFIGNFAFEDCFDLTSITIPSSVTFLGLGAFSDCVTLTNAFFSGNAPGGSGLALRRCK